MHERKHDCNNKATEWNYYKATGDEYHIHKKCAEKKGWRWGGKKWKTTMLSHTTLRKKACHGKQQCDDMSTEVKKGEHRRIGINSSSQYPCLAITIMPQSEMIKDENETSIGNTELGCHPTSALSMLNE